MLLAALSVGCLEPPQTPGKQETSPSEDPQPTDTPGTSPTTPPPPDSGTPPSDACSVVDVSWDQPYHENEIALSVTLSHPAAASVACVLASDPAEIHLAEAAAEASAHELRLAGLLADATYDCVVGAACGAQIASPRDLQIQTAAPRDLPGIAAWSIGVHGDEYILVDKSADCGFEDRLLLVVDRDGRVRWWYEIPYEVGGSVDFRYHGDDRFGWGGGWPANVLGRPRTLDLFDGQTYDSAEALPDIATSAFHHDGKELPDGRVLTLEAATVDDGLGGFEGFRVRRLDPATGAVDFDYHSQRAFDEGHLTSDGGEDPWHANWANIVDETLYVSLTAAQRIVAIDVATGAWQWSFHEGGDFAALDASGFPLGAAGFPQGQHGPEIRSDGHLLVYDNGYSRGYSQVVEYLMDPTEGTATVLWAWTEPGWYETSLGDVDWLDSGNVLITAGHGECFSSSPGDHTTLLEVDPIDGEKVWEMQYTAQTHMAYRAEPADACALFANAKYCSDVADRLDALSDVLPTLPR